MPTSTEKLPKGIPLEAVFPGPKPPPARKRRWFRWATMGVLGLGVFLWLLPTIVAHSFLLNWIVGYIAADFHGKIQIGGASLGWFSPVVFRQIEVQDGQGEPLASIAELTGRHTLWNLLWHWQNLGQVVLQGAKLYITVRPDGSNWEDALQRYFSASESQAGPVHLELEAKDAEVLFTNARSKRSWRLENLQGSLIIPPGPTQPWQLLCTGQVLPLGSDGVGSEPPGADKSAERGQLEFEMTLGGIPPQQQRTEPTPTSSSGGYFVLRGQQAPLALAEAILMRWEPMLHLEGRGSGWFVYGWGQWAEQVAAGRAATPRSPLHSANLQTESLPGTLGGLASAGPKNPSGDDQNTTSGKQTASELAEGSNRPNVPLPPDAVLMQADISSEEAVVQWERFAPERLHLKPMKLQGEVIWTNDYLEWNNFQLHCQAGQATLSGRIPLSSDTADWLAAFRQHPCQASGQLDLAQLARLLPQTLPLQADTQITSGQAEFLFTARPEPDGATWQAQLTTSQLNALHQGRPIQWPEPIRFSLLARETPKGLVLETLQCISEFLRIDAFSADAGTSISGQMDLDRLSQRLRPWVNLGDTRLAGRAALSLTWTKKNDDSFAADFAFQGDRLQVVIPAWAVEIADDIRARAMIDGKISSTPHAKAEPSGTNTASAQTDQTASTVSLPMANHLSAAKLTQYSLSRIDSAVLAFQWGQDQGEIRLRQPIAAPSLKSRWPLELRLEGQLADWVRRLKPWVDLESWQPSGAYGLAASVDFSPDALQVHQAQLAAAPFSLNAFGLQIAEPRVDLTLTGQWDRTASRILLPQARLQANPLLLEAQQVQIQWDSPAIGTPPGKQVPQVTSAPGLKLTGRLQAQGTLDHLQRWVAPTSTNGWRLGGAFTAQAEWQSDAGATTGRAQMNIRHFAYTPSPQSPPWQQTELQLAAKGRYDHQTGLLELTSCNLQGDGIGYAGTAQMRQSAQPARANALPPSAAYQLAGQLQYDWQKLSPLLRSYLGAGILLQGRGSEPLRWQGPLDLALAEASMGIGWQSLEAYGFRGGPATLHGQLSRGLLRIAPVEMALSEGKLHAAGTLRLSPTPMELVLDKGSAARQIRISQQMCNSAFQYIAPVLADVTSVEGRVSLLLDVCRVPLANPAASQIQGQLVIHNIQIGPGPLVRELATLLTREPTARLRNEAVIPFTMANGRVYHEGLELVFPEITIRTQGYVGLDQSLALTAEMPILPKWTAINPRLATAMKGQTIRLPIQGTLRRPQLDQATLRRYAAQFLQKSAENLLQEELQRQLDRLKLPGR